MAEGMGNRSHARGEGSRSTRWPRVWDTEATHAAKALASSVIFSRVIVALKRSLSAAVAWLGDYRVCKSWRAFVDVHGGRKSCIFFLEARQDALHRCTDLKVLVLQNRY